ncbi:MAG: hypothetical protein JWP97_3282 [Labilithrix sp.]|nr:hypothetical protein [Labilithrix sp.]
MQSPSSNSPSTNAGRRAPDAHAGFDRARLTAIVEPIVAAHGAELSDLELTNEGGWILRVSVEKAGANASKLSTKDAAVDLELCSTISRDLSPALDLADLIPHHYNLEVGSPGVERPLRTPADFARFVGERVKLKLRAGVEGVDGQKVLVATLSAFASETLTLVDGKKTYSVSFDDVEAAQLVFEFGPAPKPGKKKGKG